jgi:predicted RNA binding protein YcfA (HicA-like mRNA interferase family)
LPKFKTLSGKEVCEILASEGFLEVRRRGSHIIMQKKLRNDTVTVPVPNHKEIKIGTLLSIIRQSGISRNKFQV